MDFRAMLEYKCKKFLSESEIWDNEDADLYRRKGRMDEYVIMLNKRGWAVPFVLGRYECAKSGLADKIKYEKEYETHLKRKGQWDAHSEYIIYSCSGISLYLTCEDISEVHRRITIFEQKYSSYRLNIDLTRTAIFGMLDKGYLFPNLLNKYRQHLYSRAYGLDIEEENIARVLQIALAEHQLWSSDMPALCKGMINLRDSVKKIPPDYYYRNNNKHNLILLDYTQKYYAAFVAYCEAILDYPNSGKNMICAAEEMLCEALDNHIMDTHILTVKYYNIIANMVSGDISHIFHEQFPILSEVIAGYIKKTLSNIINMKDVR